MDFALNSYLYKIILFVKLSIGTSSHAQDFS